jgi:hypothetical protein
MAIIDTGGFDLMLDVTAATARRAVRPALPQSRAFQVNEPELRGSGNASLSLSSVAFAPGRVIDLGLSLAGSQVVASEIQVAGMWRKVSAQFGTIVLDGTITISDLVEASGLTVVVDLRPDGAGHPNVTVAIDEDALLASPVVQGRLIWAFFAGGEMGYFLERQEVLDEVSELVRGELLAQLQLLPAIVLATVPTLPGPCPPPVRALAVDTTATSLRMFLSLTGSAGSTAAATRDWLLRSPSTGLPVDAAYIALSNRCLLRDMVRCSLITRFGLPAGAFLASEPCMLIGPTTVALPSVGSASIRNLIAGIDESGRLHIRFDFSVPDPSGVGAFTVNGSIDQAFAFAASAPGAPPAISIAPSGPASVTSRVDVAAWVYAAAFFTGGVTLVLALAAADAIVDGFVTGAVSSALAGAMPTIATPLSLPPGAPPMSIRAITTLQGDAPLRSFTLPGPIPITIPLPFRDHDVIVNLV